MGERLYDLTGDVFYCLTAIKPGEKSGDWTVRCECGNVFDCNGWHLRNGYKKSCGCRRSQMISDGVTKHGNSDHPLFDCWYEMRARCNNPEHQSYHNYGGRGILVCERWDDFLLFVQDVGDKPTPEHSIDRIDNDGNYDPANIRWATRKEQSNNRRVNRLIEYKGETKTITEWGEILGINYMTLHCRLNRGLTVEEAFETKPKKVGRGCK